MGVRAKRGNHPYDYAAQRRRYIKWKYGITEAEYVELLTAQGGGCAICGGPQVDRRGSVEFCIDHDHATNAVRGLLCTPCNLMIGYAGDDVDRLRGAIRYLGGDA